MCNAIWEQYPSASIHVLLPWEVVGESAWAPYTPQPEEVVLATQNGVLEIQEAKDIAEMNTQYTDCKNLGKIEAHVRALLQPGIPLVGRACTSDLHIPTRNPQRTVPLRFPKHPCLASLRCDSKISPPTTTRRRKDFGASVSSAVSYPISPPFRRCWWESRMVQSLPQHLPRSSRLQRFGLHQAVRTPPLWSLPFAVLSS